MGNESESSALHILARVLFDYLKRLLGEMRHCTLQLALVLACGLGQLSPGAYFLNQDIFPAILSVS